MDEPHRSIRFLHPSPNSIGYPRMRPDVILWIYIVLLVVGGLIGYLKAGSAASLVTSAAAAAILTLCQIRVIFQPHMADVVLALLLVLFAWRLTESKKFMP